MKLAVYLCIYQPSYDYCFQYYSKLKSDVQQCAERVTNMRVGFEVNDQTLYVLTKQLISIVSSVVNISNKF